MVASHSVRRRPRKVKGKLNGIQQSRKTVSDNCNNARESSKRIARTHDLCEGQDVELVCIALAYGGKGVCRLEDSGFVVFCEHALPGEKLVARIDAVKKKFAEAHKVSTIVPHDDLVEAPCAHFGTCGGCNFQNLEYSAQLKFKEEQVMQLFSRLACVPDARRVVRPIVAADLLYSYRNNMQFAFGPLGQPALGLKRSGRQDDVVDVATCPLQSDVANRVLEAVRHLAPPGGELAQRAQLRRCMIRASNQDEESVMVVLESQVDAPKELRQLAADVVQAVPEVVSVINLVEAGGKVHVLYGASTLDMTMGGRRFNVSAKSFFQTNTSQGNRLVEVMEAACRLKGDKSEVVLDLFCGVGLLGIALADKCHEVYGVELVEDAVVNAQANAQLNGLDNCHFFQGDIGKVAASLGQRMPAPDIVVVDPNRAGFPRALTAFLRRLAPRRIVYVSCNPSTQARDIKDMCSPANDQSGEGVDTNLIEIDPSVGITRGLYELVSVTPVDMFPHTSHIETVAVLELASDH